jgi:hypothetical protein
LTKERKKEREKEQYWNIVRANVGEDKVVVLEITVALLRTSTPNKVLRDPIRVWNQLSITSANGVHIDSQQWEGIISSPVLTANREGFFRIDFSFSDFLSCAITTTKWKDIQLDISKSDVLSPAFGESS